MGEKNGSEATRPKGGIFKGCALTASTPCCPNDTAQNEIIKNWTDADVKTAFSTAQQ
jgi:hypothetical protein